MRYRMHSSHAWQCHTHVSIEVHIYSGVYFENVRRSEMCWYCIRNSGADWMTVESLNLTMSNWTRNVASRAQLATIVDVMNNSRATCTVLSTPKTSAPPTEMCASPTRRQTQHNALVRWLFLGVHLFDEGDRSKSNLHSIFIVRTLVRIYRINKYRNGMRFIRTAEIDMLKILENTYSMYQHPTCDARKMKSFECAVAVTRNPVGWPRPTHNKFKYALCYNFVFSLSARLMCSHLPHPLPRGGDHNHARRPAE